MISISTVVANTAGNVVLRHHSGSKLKEKPFRVSRTKTLDGGVYINHSGYTDGDRTLFITGTVTEAQAKILNAMAELYTSFLIGMDDGLYLGTISSLIAEDGALTMTIYIQSKESA